MNDLISRQAAIENLPKVYANPGFAYRLEYKEATQKMLSALPSADRPQGMIHIDEVYRLIAGHNNYHGDNILSAFTCLVEGKDVRPIAPLDESALGGDRFADISMFDGQITCPNCGKVLGYV